VALSATASRVFGLAATFAAPLALSACQPSSQPSTHLYEHPARVTLAAPAGSTQAALPQGPSDGDITTAIERELSMDGSVAMDEIDVTTRQGMVTLTGKVENILARDRATRVAELVKAVRAVDDRLQVVPGTDRTDDSLRLDVESALIADPTTASYGVAVTVDHGAVTLTGTMPSWAASQLAAYVAKGVKGVTELHNRTQIAYDRTPSDHEIENEIAQRLRWDVLLDGPSNQIDVEVEKGKVRLHGIVGSAAEKTRAFQDAWVTGVSAVDHAGLEVQWWARERAEPRESYVVRSDEAIEQAIRDAARYDARMVGFRVEPEVTAGMVLLRGTVDSLEARRAAEQLARNTVGVVAVKSYIRVSPKRPVDDTTLSDQVLSALLRNPITGEHEVRTVAGQGLVTLTGTVDHYYEKVEAENVAESVRGVIEVQNQLEVRHTPHAFVHEPYLYPYYPQPADSWSHYVPVHSARTDAQIRESIENELAWTPYVNAEEITISVIDGRATLTGTVGSWRERQVATDNAFEGGAIAVINRLGVLEN
jgi:osmotically-inducible protein OsmY